MKLPALLFLPLVLACSTEASDRSDSATASSARQNFGAPLRSGTPISVGEMLRTPETYTDHPVLVAGTVRSVCQNRGCWMELSDGDGAGCRVTFKDYGFFVPRDSFGAAARVDGVVAVETLGRAKVEHLESEGARFASKLPDGSARQVTIVASGVELAKN